jgi:hypothetical protein
VVTSVVCLPVCLLSYIIYLSFYLSIYLSFYLSNHLPLFNHLPYIHLSSIIYLLTYHLSPINHVSSINHLLSIYLSSICLLSVYHLFSSSSSCFIELFQSYSYHASFKSRVISYVTTIPCLNINNNFPILCNSAYSNF